RRPTKGVEHNINNNIDATLPTVFSFDLETWKHSVNTRIKEGFSKWIYQLEGKKISGMDLHRKTGMSVSEVYLYLNGTRMPSKAKFEKVFDAYDTKLCSFLEFLDLRYISETTFYDRALKRRD
ncbi:helix-turn-helix transcriptional regulator, partial [Bacillus atrophaeus]